ncbi:MAG: thymidylate synthase [Spirulina sp. DLM2.Bin59]|nr:MAG: thymidylate synthase [Spirulina sp. DLM2.Bin59]
MLSREAKKKAHKYDAQYKPNQLILGQGQVVIVTGWTPKAIVAKKLKCDDYAAIGNLYSPTRGIGPLIRNLLINTHVHKLIVLNQTKEDKNAGSVTCLLDFFKYGFEKGVSQTGRDSWVIKSEILGYIDIEIPEESLSQIRKYIEYVEAHSVDEVIALVEDYTASHDDVREWGKPKIFPLYEPKPTVLPGVRYGHRIEGETIAETWVKILHRIKTTGTIRPTGYDGNWQELIDLMAIVNNEPEGFFFPEPNFLPIDQIFLKSYIPQVVDDAPYQEGVKYSYGQRLRSWFKKDQIKQVIHKLINEIDAASAVMSLWDVQDHETGGSPCLNHIWTRVVDNELSLTAVFRSNDMFSAWPANAMGLRALQVHICEQVTQNSDYKLTLGPLITISQSAHIYDDTWDAVDQLIANQYNKICKKNEFNDPCGNFIIEVQQDEIVVVQTTPNIGEFVYEYRGKNPLKLVREICNTSPGIQSKHIGYLGIELQKAFNAIKNNKIYTQDQ